MGFYLNKVYYKTLTMKFTIFAVVIACVALMATANPVPEKAVSEQVSDIFSNLKGIYENVQPSLSSFKDNVAEAFGKVDWNFVHGLADQSLEKAQRGLKYLKDRYAPDQ